MITVKNQRRRQIYPRFKIINPMETKKEITVFAETNFRNQRKRFGIKCDDRRRHLYIIGKTGMGKTTLLENMIISDVLNGEGCCYIDPHGDTAEKILNYIPSERINDVIYFNPADTDFPIAFNVLEAVDEKDKHLIASGLISVFKKQFAESWGPRLEYILRNAILALLDYPGSTLLGIMRILVDKNYRKKVVDKVKDPVVKSFWTNEYTKWNERVLQEVISPIQNKVGQFLSNFLIRNIVGQVKSTINLRDIIDHRKILILNLSKGRIGEDTMQLLGSMIVTKIYLAAMSRVDVLEKERQDFFLYVDEFQNFATDSFADILSEARKYRLNLTIAHQYIEQLPEKVAAAIFGNVGTLICFRVGAADAESLIKEFTPFFIEEDLVNLPAFNIYLKLMVDGISSDPFSATTLPPLFEDRITNNNEKIIRISRERYTKPRLVVEDKINRWSGIDLSDQVVKFVAGAGNQAEESSEKNKPSPINDDLIRKSRKEYQKNKSKADPVSLNNTERHFQDRHSQVKSEFTAICSLCQKETKVSFEPDGIRPVFCKDCLKKNREERRQKNEKRQNNNLSPGKLTVIEELIQKEEVKNAPALSLNEALSHEPISFNVKNQNRRLEKSSRPDISLENKSQRPLKSGEVAKID